MNIFRSEEHAKRWSYYEPESEDAIMPVADWAKVFAGPMFRNRNQDDYLSRIRKYAPVFQQTLTDLGKTGAWWQRRR